MICLSSPRNSVQLRQYRVKCVVKRRSIQFERVGFCSSACMGQAGRVTGAIHSQGTTTIARVTLPGCSDNTRCTTTPHGRAHQITRPEVWQGRNALASQHIHLCTEPSRGKTRGPRGFRRCNRLLSTAWGLCTVRHKRSATHRRLPGLQADGRGPVCTHGGWHTGRVSRGLLIEFPVARGGPESAPHGGGHDQWLSISLQD